MSTPQHDSTKPETYIEDVVCHERDVEENSMKVFELGKEGARVLVVKQKGEIRAVGTKCSHYGAPLVNGALGDERIRCPWHGACFSTKTGDIEDYPGLDSIPCYEVKVSEGGDVIVRAKMSDLKTNKRVKESACRDFNNCKSIVIIGGGGSGQCCAETLRQEGFSGRLVLITADRYPPYDRVKLSKQLGITSDKIQLRNEAYYKDNDIDVLLNSKVVNLNPQDRTLTLENGDKLEYSVVFLATGSKARRSNLPGDELANIFTLRSLSDATTIDNFINPDSHVVIYGSSFIGMEAAAYCVSKAKSVTVVGRSTVPFKNSLGEEVGERIMKLFTSKGIKMDMGVSVTSFKGDHQGCVSSVILSDGREIPANVVILGLGASPVTDFLKSSGVELNNKGSVIVDEFLKTNLKDVYAGGDIAYAPVMVNDNKPASIGHWGLSHYHGKIAAFNILGKNKPLESVPFFWTMLFGTSFRYAGYADKYDDVIIGGSLDDLRFAAYYCKGNDVVAICTAGVDPLASTFAEKLAGKMKIKKDIVANNLLDWHLK